MLRGTKIISFLASILIAATAIAQAPATAPAGSTGLCRDGSYWSGATKRGACHGHKGVQDWYAGAEVPAANKVATTPSTAAVPTATTPSSTMPAAAAPAAPLPKASAPAATQAVGGGAGQVWVNGSSKVYHCASDRWYGKTKNGAYMSEADAVAKGNRPDHGKTCK